ncbi:hypothetical protein BDW59DRAFT_149573 [Aspergillus cavernicola]|uniref:Secreted protein n=1 Tax=Aspergillus cavernicola TaxID=176166 RepID=A0ABR4I421_9EURO
MMKTFSTFAVFTLAVVRTQSRRALCALYFLGCLMRFLLHALHSLPFAFKGFANSSKLTRYISYVCAYSDGSSRVCRAGFNFK